VGAYPQGVSPYGVLDMAGNVWEWTSSLYKPYPYRVDDGREDVEAGGARVVRGGSFNFSGRLIRCAYRVRLYPGSVFSFLGFRVALVSPFFSDL
jgi:formylglycine-generating enzyme required for sulfatase activity